MIVETIDLVLHQDTWVIAPLLYMHCLCVVIRNMCQNNKQSKQNNWPVSNTLVCYTTVVIHRAV